MIENKKTKHHNPKKEEQEKAEGHGGDPRVKPEDDKTGAGMTDKQEIPSFDGMKRVEELTNQLARCMADLQNYKRRSEEDKVRFVKFANAELLKILLPALENLDRSCKHLPENLKEDAWAKGVLHTQADLTKALAIIGVKRIETVGKKLDLKFHEVLMAGPGEKDMVTEELDPGYTLNGETIKAAKVKVGDGSK